MKKIKITKVGVDMTSVLVDNNGILSGKGTIYSKDVEGLCLAYADDFDFTYDTADGLVVANVDENVFGDYLEIIDAELVDNLKINYLQNN